MDFPGADRTHATKPLSPSSTPPRDVPGRAMAHATPTDRGARIYQPADDGLTSVGYRGHSEDEEVEQPRPKGSRGVRSRMSLQARSSDGEGEHYNSCNPAASHCS